mmetsp:Transcript_22863/g.58141  ORF Transcript_22863/g.58141 Transcript_22863/m.58141 type:complete len:293 (-) Transcript_22863:358-1236(-)|eukprot:CAMPEP_0115855790 /NCGR_PEP_ID=MMETSP0287-20121206/14722_1 /TAXON_ID=412157 /ORGANISM="Chrysochromulina rotalis, Strain UIO044" /LENGTH=292 /DNA_ID=CAMNT_0003309951 /DNA_START=65 /DNA_END=943 /DNA_ORIENTATION=+
MPFIWLSLLCAQISTKWTPKEIVSFMAKHPQRAYFSRLFRDGGFRKGMEVGVAGGRFSEHFLLDNSKLRYWEWTMMEPFPNKCLVTRFPPAALEPAAAGIRKKSTKKLTPEVPCNDGTAWTSRSIGSNANLTFIRELSTDASALRRTSRASYEFIYLDGAHDYANVKKELFAYWPKIAPGGVLAGHDYCYRNEAPLPLNCRGCESIPICGVYTERGGKLNGTSSKSQHGVVQAVQEWLIESSLQLKLHHTVEDFTQAGLAADGLPYDLILTKTRNPSWFVIKPLRPWPGMGS